MSNFLVADILCTAYLGNADIRVLNQWPDEIDQPLHVMPISEPGAVISGEVGPRSRFDPEHEGNTDSDVASFFRRSIRIGGVLVIIKLEDRTFRNRAESIFENQHAVAAAVNPILL